MKAETTGILIFADKASYDWLYTLLGEYKTMKAVRYLGDEQKLWKPGQANEAISFLSRQIVLVRNFREHRLPMFEKFLAGDINKHDIKVTMNGKLKETSAKVMDDLLDMKMRTGEFELVGPRRWKADLKDYIYGCRLDMPDTSDKRETAVLNQLRNLFNASAIGLEAVLVQ